MISNENHFEFWFKQFGRQLQCIKGRTPISQFRLNVGEVFYFWLLFGEVVNLHVFEIYDHKLKMNMVTGSRLLGGKKFGVWSINFYISFVFIHFFIVHWPASIRFRQMRDPSSQGISLKPSDKSKTIHTQKTNKCGMQLKWKVKHNQSINSSSGEWNRRQNSSPSKVKQETIAGRRECAVGKG